MSNRIHLLVIDPQNDFCDIPDDECPVVVQGATLVRTRPALPVVGAHADMQRLAAMIDRLNDKLFDVHVTLDSHNPVDIAHPVWWRNEAGDAPAPFTSISVDDVKNGVWKSRNPLAQAYSLRYVESLAATGRYQLIVWPEHCLIGSWGHNVHAAVAGALSRWARRRLETVHFVTKGSNPKTEHYSAVQAEVPDPDDASTLLNTDLIKVLQDADQVLIAGEALSHCVASTVRDIAQQFGDANIAKLTLLTDCSSSVTGFEGFGQQFVTEMTARGMKTALSTDFLK